MTTLSGAKRAESMNERALTMEEIKKLDASGMTVEAVWHWAADRNEWRVLVWDCM